MKKRIKVTGIIMLPDYRKKLERLMDACLQLEPYLLHGNKYDGPIVPDFEYADAVNAFRYSMADLGIH